MKAAVLYERKTLLKVEDVDLDPPKAGEVLVKVVANGVCHSDYSVINGVLPFPLPVVPGHEGAGIVEEVGPGVTLVKPGDHVVLSAVPYCGRCYYCSFGEFVQCDSTVVELYMHKKLKLDELVTRTYPLDGVNAAMTALEKGEVLRSVIVM